MQAGNTCLQRVSKCHLISPRLAFFVFSFGFYIKNTTFTLSKTRTINLPKSQHASLHDHHLHCKSWPPKCENKILKMFLCYGAPERSLGPCDGIWMKLVLFEDNLCSKIGGGNSRRNWVLSIFLCLCQSFNFNPPCFSCFWGFMLCRLFYFKNWLSQCHFPFLYYVGLAYCCAIFLCSLDNVGLDRVCSTSNRHTKQSLCRQPFLLKYFFFSLGNSFVCP